MRGKDYGLLDLASVKERLALPALGFSAADVVKLYLHRGSGHRPCSLMRTGSRTVIGGVPTHRMVRKPGKSFPNGSGICARNSESLGSPPRCVSPSFPPPRTEALPPADPAPTGPLFGPPQWARAPRVGSLGGRDFLLQADGTLRCRRGATLYPQERRPEHDGTVRVLYAARIADCGSCPFRIPCQEHGTSTKHPRRVSAVLHPLPQLAAEEQPPAGLAAPSPAAHPILWGDWSRCQPRRAWIRWQRSHLVSVQAPVVSAPVSTPSPLSRAQRAHWRMTWPQRLARNARPPSAAPVGIMVYGLSTAFAQALGLRVA
jgi:hypothetical protein